MKTREGNAVYDKSSPFRSQNEVIAGVYKSRDLCRDCDHLGDLCTNQLRDFQRVVKNKIKPDQVIASDGIARSWVVSCQGFEIGSEKPQLSYDQERALADAYRDQGSVCED